MEVFIWKRRSEGTLESKEVKEGEEEGNGERDRERRE